MPIAAEPRWAPSNGDTSYDQEGRMFRNQIIAAIRTGAAVLGAAIITWIVTTIPGVDLDPNFGTALGVALAAIGVGVYNLAVNWLTINVWDGFGWLLGINKPPTYVSSDDGGQE